MVRITRHDCAILAMLLFAMVQLSAADLVDYHVGDHATEDVTTPVALDVIDPQATASLKFEESLKTPAVFRYYPGTEATIEKEFLQTAGEAHSNFVAAVENTFHSPKVGDEVINSVDFGYLLTAFNVKSKNFPVTSDLAVEWAHGNDGQAILNHSLELIRNESRQPVRADDLPEQFLIGETLRLVSMTMPDNKLTPDVALQEGKLTVAAGITTLSQVQNHLRKQFPADQQPYAHALAVFLRADCVADPALTELIRNNVTHQLTVARHYDAGQVIVHRGEAVDAAAKAAMDVLNERLMPGLLSQQVAAERTKAEQEQEQAQTARLQALQSSKLAQQAAKETSKARIESVKLQEQALQDHLRNLKLIYSLIAVASVLLVAIGWIVIRRKRVPVQPAAMAVAVAVPAKVEVASPGDIAPQVAQAVRDAVMQEMALQRRELMIAQQMAADEIAQLVERLNLVQAPLQERLLAYESQIQRLESELAVRTEENRELLKVKIEMMRRQLEYERVRTSGDWQTLNGGTRN